MKEYRNKQKTFRRSLKKVVKNNEDIEKSVSNTVLKKIKIIQKIIYFSKISLDKTILINIFNDNIDKSYEKYINDNMNYLKNTTNFIDTFKKIYKY